MKSGNQRCQLCGLSNDAGAESCKRCGDRLMSMGEAAQKSASWQQSSKPALTACRACGRIVARHVAACPHCGQRLRTNNAARITIMLALLGALGAILFYGC